MMSSICLVNLPSPFLIDEKVFPPLGLLCLATALKEQGQRVHVHDGTLQDIPVGFDHYGISSTTPQFPIALQAKDLIKSRNKKARVIIGGPHATVDSASCLDAGFDGVVIGEGEISLQIAVESRAKLIQAPFDYYVSPDRDAIDMREYKYHIDGEPATSIMTTRGCPYSCGFCCKTTEKVRVFPAEKVIEELTELKEKYGYRAFMFFDDIFIVDIKRAHKILDAITPWGIKWRAFVRADLLVKAGKEMVRKFKESGCVEVGMGIESGSDKILETINKGENTAIMKKAIKMLKSAGIRVKGFFIIGLPGENWNTLGDTYSFIIDTKLDDVDFSIFTPFKRTRIYEHKDQYDINWDEIDLEQSWYKGTPGEYHSQVYTSVLSKEQIVRARDYLEKHFKKW